MFHIVQAGVIWLIVVFAWLRIWYQWLQARIHLPTTSRHAHYSCLGSSLTQRTGPNNCYTKSSKKMWDIRILTSVEIIVNACLPLECSLERTYLRGPVLRQLPGTLDLLDNCWIVISIAPDVTRTNMRVTRMSLRRWVQRSRRKMRSKAGTVYKRRKVKCRWRETNCSKTMGEKDSQQVYIYRWDLAWWMWEERGWAK